MEMGGKDKQKSYKCTALKYNKVQTPDFKINKQWQKLLKNISK